MLQMRKKKLGLNYKRQLISYYEKFMGYGQREFPINQEYHRIIVSRKFNTDIFKRSISQNMLIDKQTKDIILNTNDLHNLFIFLHGKFNNFNGYRVRKMQRMAMIESFDKTKMKIKAINTVYKIENKKYLQLKQHLHKLELLNLEGKKLAICKVTNIDYNGANIWLYVNDEYRRQGLGTYILFKMLQHLKAEHLVPIFLVNNDNIPAIKVAQNLSFNFFASEVIVSQL